MDTILYWEPVCGNDTPYDAFWYANITVNAESPDFTKCFEDTVLVWSPCVYLILASVFYLTHLLWKPTIHSNSELSKFNIFKIILGSLLCWLALAELLKSGIDEARGNGPTLSLFLKPGLLLLCNILATILINLEFRKGIHSGGVLFFWWLVLLILGIFEFRTKIILISYDESGSPVIEDVFRFSTFFIYYTLVLIQFISSLWADTEALKSASNGTKHGERQPLLASTEGEGDQHAEDSDGLPPCPEISAPFWKKLLFIWITRMIVAGYRRSLDFTDLFQLLPRDKCNTVIPRFERAWQTQLEKTNYKLIRPARDEQPKLHQEHFARGEKLKDTEMLPEVKFGAEHKKKKEVGPSSWKAIVATFGGYYMIGGIYKAVYDVLGFLNPQVLNLLITFIATQDPLQWRGYLYAVVMFATAMLRTVFLQQYWHSCYVTGMQLRTAVTGTIYRKSLKLNSTSRKGATAGEIVNLMSVDAQKLQDAPAFMHMLWSAPLTIILAMYFLWQQLGPSVLAGLGFMLLLVPINAFIATKTRKLQIAQMRFKDSRIKLMNEVLNGIKVLKLYAWEDSFRERVFGIREQELHNLKTAAYLNAASAISWTMAPYLISLGSFAVYVLSSPDNVLDANKAFVSLSLFNLMNYPLSILPAVISYGVQASVSIGRITRFLKSEELDPEAVSHAAASDAVVIDRATFSWGREETSTLKNINLRVPNGHLIAIVGQVGAGKSSIIQSLLGEMEVLSGTVNVSGSIAYVPQQAWIQNATLKDNILFGREANNKVYTNVVDACALTPDLKILPGGDQTEIGEKGINLSGGQKQRVSLARAVYQNSDIYLLDDPLSAVDSHVGKHIFDKVVGPDGLLRNKTRILVTNGISFLSQMDMIVVMRNGEVSELGSYEDLLSSNGAFADFITTYLNEAEEVSDEDPEIAEVKMKLQKSISIIHDDEDSYSRSVRTVDRSVSDHGSSKKSRRKSMKSRKSSMFMTEAEREDTKKEFEKQEKQRKNKRLTEEEQAATGTVKLSVFLKYIKACGVQAAVCVLFWYLITLSAQVYANIWLSMWSQDQPINGTQDIPVRNLRLGVYGGIGLVQGVSTLAQSFSLAIATISSSRILHAILVKNVLRAPMSFFDTTPLGRIINRFSKDVDTLDVNIPITIRIWMATASVVITTLFVISYSTPIFLAIMVPLGLFYYFVQRFYISASRQLKRIDSIRRSPIYAHFSETLSGGPSIRAYGVEKKFIQHSDKLVDQNQMTYYPNIVSNRWLGIWLESIGNSVVLFSAILAVTSTTIDAGLAGLSVSYALQVTGALNMMVRMTSDMENYVVAVERIEEYVDCPQEAPNVVEGNKPERSWPPSGTVEFNNYSTRYRQGLDLVLNDISCEFTPGEKVGIVGRTGAGKSSLTLALFRIIEAAGGHIVIDGVKIDMIGLQDLRSKITIIPQDPVIFAGTLRMNLDPFERHSDNEIWSALEHAHLKTFVETNLTAGLEHKCTEGGENLSVGQRQLVCLARALLRKTRILVLDEATAAIDMETDDLIQTTIRTQFTECTVITIAHRLNTIMDYSRVLVLDKGRIVEFDSPPNLLQSKGVFYDMAKDAGLVSQGNGNAGEKS